MKKNRFSYLILLLIMASCVLCSWKQDVTKKNIGLQLYSVRDEMRKDPVRTVEEVGKMGYSFVEAAGYSGGKFYDMAPAEFKALVEKNGMLFLSSHTGCALPDSAGLEAVMAWWDTCIAAHAEAGVRYIVQPFMDNVGYTSLDGLKRYCDYFNAIGEKCNARGIRFGYVTVKERESRARRSRCSRTPNWFLMTPIL